MSEVWKSFRWVIIFGAAFLGVYVYIVSDSIKYGISMFIIMLPLLTLYAIIAEATIK